MRLRFKRSSLSRPLLVGLGLLAGIFVFGVAAVLTLSSSDAGNPAPFTTTVDPIRKVIREDPKIEALFQKNDALPASVLTAGKNMLEAIALAIVSSPSYLALANPPVRYVKIVQGYRKEQVANVFAAQLDWSAADKSAFLTATAANPPVIPEGRFAPGLYEVAPDAKSLDVRSAIVSRFDEAIAARYTPELERTIPLEKALAIASIIEREAGSLDDMRLISGIIWNRLFAGMRLQIDATLQYAKGSAKNGWWPAVYPNDKYRKSPYNTYLNDGLPPSPIANPSVEAVEAALNPAKTDCLYYFHDARRGFHCAATYDEHVAALVDYYGSGK